MSSNDRNIVLITSDSLRADYCGFLNDGVSTTPTLDRMAKEGVVFENAIAPGPRTPSSIPEICTGELLPKTQGDLTDWATKTARIRGHMGKHETLAEKLSEQGYTTIAFTANPWTTRSTNFDKGFDHFQEIKNSDYNVISDLFSDTALRPLVKWLNKEIWFSQWPMFYEDVIETVKQTEPPYFLWVFLLDTHSPYIVPRQDRKESSMLEMYYTILRSSRLFGEASDDSYYRKDLPPSVETRIKQIYRDSIRSVDRFVSTLWADVAEDDPLLAFHSDHGEAFDEHGTYGHQQVVYEENIHVPLLVYNTDSSATVREPISLRTLPGMLASYAKEGRIEPPEWTSEYTVSRTEDGRAMAVRGEQWKYIVSNNDEELYDLASDPEERLNLIDQQDTPIEQLRATLESYEQRIPEREIARDRLEDPDTELKDRLESLGYIG